ncbi:MAG: hypothetical protein AAF266_05890 [Planctomycetota bacterium]
MNLLRVQCETCQAWLRVRDPGFVGEVHACPRCGGMVLIAASPAAASEDGPLEAETPVEAAPEPISLGLSNTLETVEVPPPETTHASPVPPTEVVEPIAEAARSFGWAPIATTVVSLVSTVAILAVWFAVGSPDASAPPVAQAIEPAPRQPAAPTDTPVPEPVRIEEQPPAVEPPPIEPAPIEVVEATPEPARVEPEPQPTPPPAERVALATHEEPPRAIDPIEPASEIDPLDIDPNEVELVLRRGPADEAEMPAESTEPVLATRKPAGFDLDAELAAAGRQAGVFVRRGPTDDSTGPPIGSAEKALTFVLPEVALRDIPLNTALDLLGKLVGTPITLSPQALRRGGVPANRPVDVVAEGESLATILRATLDQARLGYVTDGPHITVVRTGVGTRRTIKHRLTDLARNDPEALNDLLRRFVPLNDNFALDASGEAELTADLGTHYDLLVFCERLRVARGLPTDSKYPRELLTPEPSLAQLAKQLDRRTTFTFVEPTPLAEVFDHWRRVTDLPILVDWRSLADVGLGPQSTIECSVTNRPWQAALDGVLEPLGLTWAAFNGNALVVTTRRPPEPLATTEFYPADEATAAAVVETLSRSHPETVHAFDKQGGSLLVRGTAASHRAVWEAFQGR